MFSFPHVKRGIVKIYYRSTFIGCPRGTSGATKLEAIAAIIWKNLEFTFEILSCELYSLLCSLRKDSSKGTL